MRNGVSTLVPEKCGLPPRTYESAPCHALAFQSPLVPARLTGSVTAVYSPRNASGPPFHHACAVQRRRAPLATGLGNAMAAPVESLPFSPLRKLKNVFWPGVFHDGVCGEASVPFWSPHVTAPPMP